MSSNIDGFSRVGSRLLVGATPMKPARAAARSDRISACYAPQHERRSMSLSAASGTYDALSAPGEFVCRTCCTRFVATAVSRLCGFNTFRAVMASTSIISHFKSEKSAATLAATSSQSTIPLRYALLFVATVSSSLSRLRTVSNAKLVIRSTPWRVKIDTSIAAGSEGRLGATEDLERHLIRDVYIPPLT